MKNKLPIIGFAGLTHLGINSAIASASKGFKTFGYHDDQTIIQRLNDNDVIVEEPNLSKLFIENKNKLSFSNDPKILNICDIVYIAYDIPTNEFGESNLKPINKLIKLITNCINSDALLVVLCQIPPGYTRKIKWPKSQLFYQVETLIFGRAVERALYPERIIFGVCDKETKVDKRINVFLKAFNCPIISMRYESAELAKISINLCLVSMISTANTLAEVCEKIGADWEEIVPALKLDKRIGMHAYLSAGLGISGGNLERDLVTIQNLSKSYNTDQGIVNAWLYNSNHRKDWVWKLMQKNGLENSKDIHIGILGISYKENTDSVKNSPSLKLLSHLKNCNVKAYDPKAIIKDDIFSFERVNTIKDAISGVDYLAVMTPWEEFKKIKSEDILQLMNGNIIYDPYRILDGSYFREKGFQYYSLGSP